VLYRAGLSGFVLVALAALPVLGIFALLVNKYILTAVIFGASVSLLSRFQEKNTESFNLRDRLFSPLPDLYFGTLYIQPYP